MRCLEIACALRPTGRTCTFVPLSRDPCDEWDSLGTGALSTRNKGQFAGANPGVEELSFNTQAFFNGSDPHGVDRQRERLFLDCWSKALEQILAESHASHTGTARVETLSLRGSQKTTLLLRIERNWETSSLKRVLMHDQVVHAESRQPCCRPQACEVPDTE